jgi:rhodanese-related sulfurtransferase
MSRPTDAVSVEQMLAQARSELKRLSPPQAHQAVTAGALLVDIRPGWQRAAEGEIPGALLVERNHLEWRFDPECAARLPQATGYDIQVIVFCSEGYSSSLAADSLRRLGLHRATDVVGGFHAWATQGLPVQFC